MNKVPYAGRVDDAVGRALSEWSAYPAEMILPLYRFTAQLVEDGTSDDVIDEVLKTYVVYAVAIHEGRIDFNLGR